MIDVLLTGIGCPLKNSISEKSRYTDIYAPYKEASNILLDFDINLYTELDKLRIKPKVIIYFEHIKKVQQKFKHLPSILLRLEPPTNKLYQWKKSINNKFDLIGSFNNLNIDKKKYFNIGYPFDFSSINFSNEEKIRNKSTQYSMIIRNKLPRYLINTNIDLTSKRHAVIDYFENNLSLDFKLYGKNWGLGKYKPKLFNFYYLKVLEKIFSKFINKKTFLAPKNYFGIIDNKVEVVEKSKFVFCYENTIMNGYLTEKITDVLKFGSIPIYIGDKIFMNDKNFKEMFINPLNFYDLQELIDFCNGFDNDDYLLFLNKAQNILKNNEYIFSPLKFSQQLSLAIKSLNP